MTAVVTGGAGAIGRSIGAALRAEGREVLLVDRAPAVHETAAELGAHALVADLGDADAPDAIAAAAGELGQPSLLVNNAGITRDGRAERLSEADFRAVIAVNLVAPLRLAEALAPRLAAGGAVVNIASRAGLGNFGQANYVAAKSGLMGATRALALRWAPRLRVNAVAPGLVSTPMTAAMPPEVLEKLVARVPAGRAAQAREIAQAVAFLGSPRASYVTGQTLFVCGGRGLSQ
jgi:NAD(P)-dependent dehydrogenase (short-subunit alcohol dehydrogenase family)